MICVQAEIIKLKIAKNLLMKFFMKSVKKISGELMKDDYSLIKQSEYR